MKIPKMATMLLMAAGMVPSVACEGTIDGAEPSGSTRSSLVFVAPGASLVAFDLVGRGLNGSSYNGGVLDGRVVASVSLAGVELSGGKKRDLRLEGSVFKGVPAPGRGSSRSAIIGAVFQAALDDGGPMRLRIEEAVDSGSGYLEYRVSYQSADGWKPMCGTDGSGAPVLAIPLNGLWIYEAGVDGGGSHVPSDSSFTFGCAGHVLAKCVAMGYQPWIEGWICPGGGMGPGCVRSTLGEHHQACTRLLRADYCGDGTSHTLEGLSVDAYDGLGIRVDSEDWVLEAEWTPDGARCVSAVRLDEPGDAPSCLASLALGDCGDPGHLGDGSAFLMSEIPGSASTDASSGDAVR